MRALEELYLAAFVVFFEFGRENWRPAINAWKAVAGVTWIQLSLVAAVLCWLPDLHGRPLLLTLPTLFFYLIAGALGIANYRFLVTVGKGASYEQEFHRLPSRKKLFIVTRGILAIVSCVAILFVSALVVRQRLLR